MENLKGIYKPSSIVASELLEYNENDDNFKIFSIFSGESIEDHVLRKISQNTKLVFDLLFYLSECFGLFQEW